MFELGLGTAVEVVARVVVVYVVLLMLLRSGGRRTMSDITPMDIMVMLLISETVSPALTAGEESVAVGLVAATTLIVLSVLTSALVFRSRVAERLISGATVLLIKDGRVRDEVMRRFRITDEDLQMALHQNGLLAVDEVRRAFVESDGEITVVPRRPEKG